MWAVGNAVCIFWTAIGIALLYTCNAANHKETNRLQDLQAVQNLEPLIQGPNVFFWRPQKVGSSTMLSLLMSYGYRYNFLPKRKSTSNAYCRLFAKCAIVNKMYPANHTQDSLESYITQKIPGTPSRNQQLSQKDLDAEKLSNSVPYKISLSHEICNLNAQVIEATMPCTFSKKKKKDAHEPVRELFMLRDPLSRSISVYYFWGELYKMKHGLKRASVAKSIIDQEDTEGGDPEDEVKKEKRKKSKKSRKDRDEDEEGQEGRRLAQVLKLGQSDFSDPVTVHGQRFQYHGQESTAPSLQIALRYANHTIYRPGMPGPSNTWSAFADSLTDGLTTVASDRICTIVLERLPESLVVAAHYLNWSLADVVVVKHRKALSVHPKHTDWPAAAVQLLRAQLNAPEVGEYAMYNASVRKLDERITRLTRAGINVSAEVDTLLQLQKRVSEICLDDEYLTHYRDMIAAAGLPAHPSQNKLRDVEEKYVKNGHMFSFNREILMSFDVCGPCEAHALLLGVQLGLAKDVSTAPSLKDLNEKYRRSNPNFAKCPSL